MVISTESSHSSTRMKARTASAIDIASRLCDGRCTSISCEYMLTAQRAMHSISSPKSSVAASDFSASTSPISCWSMDCERRKFQRTCGIESAALKWSCCFLPTRSSPVISDSCEQRHSPTILGHGGLGPRTSRVSGSGPSISATHMS